MVFGVRDGEARARVLAGLPELTLGGLPEEVAHELLATSADVAGRRAGGPAAAGWHGKESR